MEQKPTLQKDSQVSQRPESRLSAGVLGAFLKRGGLVGYTGLVSVIAVLAPLRRKEVSDAYAVVDHLAVHEHLLVFGLLLAHGRQDSPPAY